MSLEFHTSVRHTCADPNRPLVEQVNETVGFVHAVRDQGVFTRLSFQHHWLSYPTVWIEPFPLIARLAPETGQMRLMTSVIKLPIHNPVELAHYVATVDHITNGRLDFGIALGYQQEELEAVGASRKERVSRFDESVELMKRLWTGEGVRFRGRYWKVDGRMGYTPLQRPHPPLFVAAYAVGAARRAARIHGTLLAAPQASWTALEAMAREYDDEASKVGINPSRGANRNICVAANHDEAIRMAQMDTARRAKYYNRWGMNEPGVIEMVLDGERDPRDYAIVGTPDECIEMINRYKEKVGLHYMGLSFMNMPEDKGLGAKLDYIQYLSEEVLKRID